MTWTLDTWLHWYFNPDRTTGLLQYKKVHTIDERWLRFRLNQGFLRFLRLAAIGGKKRARGLGVPNLES